MRRPPQEKTMSDFYQDPVGMARRAFLLKSCSGLGALAVADLLGVSLDAQTATASVPRGARVPGILAAPHFPPRANRVIYVHMLGAISHVDTFDYKPLLEKM